MFLTIFLSYLLRFLINRVFGFISSSKVEIWKLWLIKTVPQCLYMRVDVSLALCEILLSFNCCIHLMFFNHYWKVALAEILSSVTHHISQLWMFSIYRLLSIFHVTFPIDYNFINFVCFLSRMRSRLLKN